MPEVLLDSSAYIDLERANRHRSEPWAVATLRRYLAYCAAYGKPCLSVVSVVEILHGLHRDAVGGKARYSSERSAKTTK